MQTKVLKMCLSKNTSIKALAETTTNLNKYLIQNAMHYLSKV